jgi:hypothetical protein
MDSVRPRIGYSQLVENITQKLLRLNIEEQGIIKLSLIVTQNGFIKFSDEFYSQKHKEASRLIKRALMSSEWVFSSENNRNRIEHHLELTFNLVPQ